VHSFSPLTVCNFFGKRISAQKLLIKCWQNWLQVSISSTLNARILRTKAFFWQLFLVTFWLWQNFFFVWKSFVWLFSKYSLAMNLFWKRNIGIKTACKILMKLTHGNAPKMNKTETTQSEVHSNFPKHSPPTPKRALRRFYYKIVNICFVI